MDRFYGNPKNNTKIEIQNRPGSMIATRSSVYLYIEGALSPGESSFIYFNYFKVRSGVLSSVDHFSF